MRRFAGGLIILTASLTASAQSMQGITSPRMINPPDSPLWITSITMNLTDALQTVTIRNVSGHTISSFQLGVIMAVPPTCGPKENFSRERVMQADRITLQPGATTQTHDYRLLLTEIASFGIINKASDVQTQVAVIRVNFADGSVWKMPAHAGIYDSGVMASNAKLRCGQDAK